MDKITIIIAHYDPGDSDKIKNAFIKTLVSIEQQINNYNVEVIVADDGSYYTSSLESTLGIKKKELDSYYQLDSSQIQQLLLEYYNNEQGAEIIANWIILPKNENPKNYKIGSKAYSDDGILCNSSFLNGMEVEDAKKNILNKFDIFFMG